MTEERKKEFYNFCITFESGIVANFQLALIMAQNYKEEFEEKYQVCYEDLVEAVDNLVHILPSCMLNASPIHPHSTFLRRLLNTYVGILLSPPNRKFFFIKAMRIAQNARREFYFSYGVPITRCFFLVQYDRYRMRNMSFTGYIRMLNRVHNISAIKKQKHSTMYLLPDKTSLFECFKGATKIYFDEAEFLKDKFPNYDHSF